MIASELLIKLINLGVELSIDNDKLVIDAKPGTLTEELILDIRASKEEIISILKLRQKNENFRNIVPTPEKPFYNLSSAQKRLYLLQQMEPESVVYNMPFTITLDKGIDKSRVESIIRQLIHRHECFRTSFEVQDELPVQRIHEKVEFDISYNTISLSNLASEQLRFTRTFNLSQAPLLRAQLVDVEDGNQLLMLDMHHIISDGVSYSILEKEFHALYSGITLPPLKLHYKDYCEWQNSEEYKIKIKQQENYWLRKFEGEIPILNLPIDYVRPKIQNHEGASVSFVLNHEQAKDIKVVSKQHELTLYMFLLSAFKILLSKLGNQGDIIVGTPIAGRNHVDLEGVVGVFINTLAIRSRVEADDTLSTLMGKVKVATLEAFDNQSYPFEDLVEKVSVERDTSRSPLFDVMFNLLNIDESSRDLSALSNQTFTHTQGISKFDLSLIVVEQSEQLVFSIEYCTKLFMPESIERYIGYLKRIILQLVENPNQTISETEILSQEEKNQLLYEFNSNKVDYPKGKTIHQLFEEQVEKTPDSIAVVFGDKQICYSELNKRANQLSRYLKSKGVVFNDKVALMLDRSEKMIVGVFGILKSGGCYVPIDSNYPKSRVEYILENSEAKLLLIEKLYAEKFELNVQKEIVEDLELDLEVTTNLNLEFVPNVLSYIIYTSGSTGEPKGVLIEHSSVVNLLYFLQDTYPICSGDSYLFKTSICFDVSICELFGWILGGGKLAILAQGQEKEPLQIIKFVSTFRVTHVNFVPTVFKLFTQSFTQTVKNDLISLKYIMLGGEALLREHLQEFFELKLNTQIVNLYGPTEATVCSSHYIATPQDSIISIGKPVSNFNLYVLGEKNSIQPIGVVGELYVGGKGLALGYQNSPELTRAKFITHPFKNDERIYRTGDLVRWLSNGNIDFLGRIDHQVKIRGFRIELGEIENALLMYEGVNQCAVIAREDSGEKYLCAYVVMNENITHENLRSHLSKRLPDYMIPSNFVSLKELPLNSSGKVDRKSLPAPEITIGLNYVAPSNSTEFALVSIWSEVLKVPKETIGVTENFFRIGGHSLKAAILTGKIHREFGVELPLRDVFTYPTIKEQSNLVSTSNEKAFVSIPKASLQDYYPLSSAQKRLYLLQQMDLEAVTYNMPFTIHLGHVSDNNKIEWVLKQLIHRHESLRTSFEVIGGIPVQRIHDDVEFSLTHLKIPKSKLSLEQKNFIKVFDLSQTPLLRATLVEVENGDKFLLLDMHHIISDGVSHSILEKEFRTLYNGEALSSLKLQYKDYSEWQNHEDYQLKIKEQEIYWLQKFDGDVPVLNLPTDFVRPNIQSHDGANVSFVLNRDESKTIKSFADNHGLTLYMTLLSAYSILLSRLTNQEDIVIGTPVAGRGHADLEQIVGVFINTLAVRFNVKSDNTLKEFMGKMKQTTLEAFDHQDYQFEDLVDKVSITRDPSRNPLFDVMFNLLNIEEYSGDISNVNDQQLIHISGVSKFDLTLTAFDFGDQIHLSFDYCTKLIAPETINRYIEYFRRIINQLPTKIENNLSEIELISFEERDKLLFEFNNTRVDYPKDKTIHQLFEEQVLIRPDSIAVTRGEFQITYKELSVRSNNLAGILAEEGVEPGSIVGLMCSRTIEMVIGTLSILKRGCIYMPIDADYPLVRKNFMINDSGLQIMLTDEEFNEEVKYPCKVLRIQNVKKIDKVKELPAIMGTSGAYIMYTSGSTGLPKGVLVKHEGVARLVKNSSYVPLTENTIILQTGAIVFDATTFEMWGSLLNGGKLVLVDKEKLVDANQLGGSLNKHYVNTLWLSSALFNQLVQTDSSIFRSLKWLIVGGDIVSPAHVQRVKLANENITVVNGYGPTENTTFSTTYTIINSELATIPIGKPISNSSCYVVSKDMLLQPIGVQGELCVGGDGLSYGYLNNPELSNEKFVENPFNKSEILYRTGDLVRWLTDGHIEFLGRVDHQVKIRGYRIELGEIENILLKHQNILECVVIDRESSGDKHLCAYIAGNDIINQEVLRDYLSARLPDYMIPSYFIQLEKLPLNTNGKVDRKALPSPEIKAGSDYEAPSNTIEYELLKIWSYVLNIPEEGISTSSNFFSIGGHSLNATILTGKIFKEMGVEFPLREIFVYSTIKSQAAQIVNRKKVAYSSIPKALSKECYALSSAQKRLYFLQQMDLTSTVYNMPYMIHLGMNVDKERIKKAFQQLISRHESLRTSFEVRGENPVQLIHETVEFDIPHFTIVSSQMKLEQSRFIKAFDLSKAPLLHIFLLEIQDEGCLLMIDIHHIISDGVSQNILEEEFHKLYRGEKLPEQKLQYKDYSEWQRSVERQTRIEKQKTYWEKLFIGEIPVLNLPTDYARPTIQSYEGANINFNLSIEETKKLRTLTQENGLTLYMSILSVFTILLSKLSGQEDIIIGSPIAGRNHTELERIVGMFVNTLALRFDVNGDTPLLSFLKQVRQTSLDAFEHQDYQFEDLVEKVSVNRDTSRNPIFDVMFNLLNQLSYSKDESRSDEPEFTHTSGVSKFDLNLAAIDYGIQIGFNLEYSTKLFKPESIERYINYFRRIIDSISSNYNQSILDIEIISPEEKHQLLYEFNNTKVDYPSGKTLHKLFEDQVERTPYRIALVFGDKNITYHELNCKANRIARNLVNQGICIEDRVGIIVERSIDMIVQILGIIKSGGVYVPISPSYPESRIEYILSNSDAKLLIAQRELSDKLHFTSPAIVYDDLDLSAIQEENLNLTIEPNNLSYIIYTSGSTGNPKGVQVEHGSVVNLLHFLQDKYPIGTSDLYLLKTSYCFDVSISELFGWILGGGKLSILEPSLEKDPISIVNAIYREQITHINFVPSAFNLFTQIIRDSDKYKLRSLKYVMLAGEALLRKHINNFFEIKPEIRIENLYGPTEATVYSSHYSVSQEINAPIYIGKPISNYCAYILDKSGKLQPIGIPGELCISGVGLSRGYINNTLLTQKSFKSYTFKGEEKLYHTGDLVRWLPNGNIEFLGRIDHQVKIRGFRIELGEIENALLKHERVKESVVISRDDNGDKYLCAYVVSDLEIEENELRAHLSGSLPDYMVPSLFVRLEQIPLTDSGKVDRKKLPLIDFKIGNDYVPPSNEMEEKLLKIWSNVLSIPKETVSVTANFFSIGGHSLKAALLSGKIHKELDIEFPLREVFNHFTIKMQAAYLAKKDKRNLESIPKAKPKECYSLSSMQKRLYLLQQMNPESVTYNMPITASLGAGVNKDQIEEILRKLIYRHESLRTSFVMVDDEPKQFIHNTVEFNLQEAHISKNEVSRFRERFIRAFDLSQAPIVRAALVDIEKEGYLLMFDMHHIIGDGLSYDVIEREFRSLLGGEMLPPLRLQYKDFSEWQETPLQRELITSQKAYWLNKLGGELPVLNLPTDNPRQAEQNFEGASVVFIVSKEITDKLKLFGKEQGLTQYMTILSAYTILLSKLSGQHEIVVGTPVTGRRHIDLANMVGMFVNTIALRIALNGNSTIKELLKIVRQTTIEAFEHQNYPFEELVENLVVKRDLSRNPIFDVMFNLLNFTDYSEDLMVLEEVKQKHTPGISKFDLTLSAIDYGDQFLMNFEYSTQLFNEETIDQFIVRFQQLLKYLPDILEERVSTVDLILENEKLLLLQEFNNTKSNYPKDKTIHQLFEEQVLKTPDKIAAIRNDVQITYKDLNIKSNALSSKLIEDGIQQGSIIGLMCGRTIEMLVGMLSILKSGCIYLPIDADYPLARKKYLINDSGLKLVLTDMDHDNGIEELCKTIRISENYQEQDVKKLPSKNNNPNAYIMYTSGSTGLPKGVLVRHKGVVRLVMNSNYASLTEETIILQTGAIVFDATTFEVWGALLNGGKLILVDKEEISNAPKLGISLCKQNVNTLWLSSALFNQLVQDEPKIFRTVKWLLVGGDIVSPTHVKKVKLNNPEINVVNGYGPTENTTFSTTYLISSNENTSIPIGAPISNSTCFIVSDEIRLEPIGVSGELCVGGDGLSAGYLNNPELTHEKFIENPFVRGETIYRTGDLTRRLSNGNIEFLGRKDNQMKIRGFRIEPGEIESVLLKHEEVKECIVLVHEKDKEKFLCAYIVLHNANKFSVQSLREYITGLLPEYMIPSFFIQIDKIPLTPNGKLNRGALPLPEISAGLDYRTPSNEIEKQLVNIWSEVLQIPSESISTNDNFFAIGGHSLRASTCISKMRKVFNADIPLVEIFRNPTISQLANIISTSGKTEHLDNIFLLKEGKKNGENIFLIHDGSGDVDGYIELCQHADDEMNYWGIKATKFKRLETYNITIEQIAQEYLKDILNVQNLGEFRIMGWSLGGSIALEIARLLEQKGFKVSFLGIIDSTPQKGLEDFYKPEFTIESEIEWLKQIVNNQDIFKDLDSVKNLGQLWFKAIDLLKNSGISNEIIKKGLMRVAGYSIKDHETLSVDELTTYMNFTRTLLRASSNYTPYCPVLSKITYFRASESVVENPQLWLNYSENNGTIHTIKADHFTILKQPAVYKLYDELSKSLKMEEEKISSN